MSATKEEETVSNLSNSSNSSASVEQVEYAADETKTSNEDSNDVSMFASVWVKVEVMEEEREFENPTPKKDV